MDDSGDSKRSHRNAKNLIYSTQLTAFSIQKKNKKTEKYGLEQHQIAPHTNVMQL